jgi:class 3 adenylate cyclase
MMGDYFQCLNQVVERNGGVIVQYLGIPFSRCGMPPWRLPITPTRLAAARLK